MSDSPKRFLPTYVTQDIRGILLQGVPNSQLSYVHRQLEASKESFCWLEIPMSLLLCWESTHKNSCEFESFISLLHNSIPGAGFAVCGDSERVEERLRNKCCITNNTFRSLVLHAFSGYKVFGKVEWLLKIQIHMGGCR